MKKYIVRVILLILVFICYASLSEAQNKIKYSKKETRKNWGLGFVYSENGFGFTSKYFVPVSRSSEISFGLLVSGVTDSREIERYDIYGNSLVYGKINRIFMIPLSIGLNKELFKGDIEGDFKPVFNIGISPTLVLLNPYNKNFFNALGYTTTKFAVGPYAGIGVNYKQSESMSLDISLSYYYLPLVNGSVESIQYNEINNVGGFQLLFGIAFMK
jgi:outer membrane protein W